MTDHTEFLDLIDTDDDTRTAIGDRFRHSVLTEDSTVQVYLGAPVGLEDDGGVTSHGPEIAEAVTVVTGVAHHYDDALQQIRPAEVPS